MSRKFKTSQKKREEYIYYTAEGTRILITPGEDGATEALIETLHNYDDADVDEQRRYDYRITAHWIPTMAAREKKQMTAISI